VAVTEPSRTMTSETKAETSDIGADSPCRKVRGRAQSSAGPGVRRLVRDRSVLSIREPCCGPRWLTSGPHRVPGAW